MKSECALTKRRTNHLNLFRLYDEIYHQKQIVSCEKRIIDYSISKFDFTLSYSTEERFKTHFDECEQYFSFFIF